MKQIAIMLITTASVAVLIACSESNENKTVDYYMKNRPEREAAIAECTNKYGGALSQAPTYCATAFEAKRQVMLDEAIQSTK